NIVVRFALVHVGIRRARYARSNSQEMSWITSGMTQSDVNNLMSQNTWTDFKGNQQTDVLFPIMQSDLQPGQTTLHNQNLFDWQGITGFRQADLNLLANYIGQRAYLPMFAPAVPDYSGGGNNYVASVKNPG